VTQRSARTADSTGDIARTLDDILSLARVGRISVTCAQGAETADLAAAMLGMIEEFEDLDQPVSLQEGVTAPPRAVACVQVTRLKRRYAILSVMPCDMTI
jgi:hypothetical protein